MNTRCAPDYVEFSLREVWQRKFPFSLKWAAANPPKGQRTTASPQVLAVVHRARLRRRVEAASAALWVAAGARRLG
jgi:hypothetical protein